MDPELENFTGRRSHGGRNESSKFSDSQRTITEMRRVARPAPLYKPDRSLIHRGKSATFEPSRKDENKKSEVVVVVRREQDKSIWRKKEIQPIPLSSAEKIRNSLLSKKRSEVEHHPRAPPSPTSNQCKEGAHVKVADRPLDAPLDVSPERIINEEEMEFPPLTADQEAELEKELAAADLELGMDAEMIENDNLLDDDYLQDSEKLDAISQLIPSPSPKKLHYMKKIFLKGRNSDRRRSLQRNQKTPWLLSQKKERS